jgi:hypothetical protein
MPIADHRDTQEKDYVEALSGEESLQHAAGVLSYRSFFSLQATSL